MLVMQSMLAIPVMNNDALFAIVYAEHDEIDGAFSAKLLPTLSAIGTQFAISYESVQSTELLRASKVRLEELSKVRPQSATGTVTVGGQVTITPASSLALDMLLFP